jgi:hypothetical protein
MHDASWRSVRWPATILLVLGFALSACSGASGSAGTAASSDTGGSATEGAAEAPAPGGSPGETNVTGSLVSSGLYDATWTWQPGNAADIGTGGVTLNSDKGTFGNIQVLADGSITFSSGAPELSGASTFTGTGAQVHMKDASGTQLPCGWTLDNDVTGAEGGILHLKGTMDVSGTAFGCP